MSMGAESAARSECPPSHAFGAAGASRSGQAAMQTAEPVSLQLSLGRGDRTGVGEESARPSKRQHFEQPGTAWSMWTGLVGSARSSMISFETSAAQPSSREDLQSIGLEDVPDSTTRGWLEQADVVSPPIGRPRALSAAQIEVALRAWQDHINRGGHRRGSVQAAHNALNDPSINISTFRNYFHGDGLTAYGKSRLEQVRESEARASRSGQHEG